MRHSWNSRNCSVRSGWRVAFAAAVAIGAACCVAIAKPEAAAPDTRTPVLVELFTSEGCSSCPPADALLEQLDAKQPIAGVDVIVLEHHVDYWDDQGWRDPFSMASATDRQRKYAYVRHGQGDQVYTPQMVVDGGDQFNGSDARRAQQSIENAARNPKSPIELSWAGSAGENPRELRVHIPSLVGLSKNDKPEVFLAVIENGLHSNVKRGENAGRSLDHAGVVREISSVGRINGESFDGTARVKLAKDWNAKNLRAVIFIQDTRTDKVFGASEIAY